MYSIPFILYIILLCFEIIFNEECKNTIAKSRNDCFTASSSPNSYCCFASVNKNCQEVIKNEINDKNYDCGVTEDNYGKYDFQQYHPQISYDIGFQTCGKKEPKNHKDCHDYSDIGNNCCYFKYNGIEACFYIGREVDKNNKMNKYGDIEFDCFSLTILFNFYSIILILFLL